MGGETVIGHDSLNRKTVNRYFLAFRRLIYLHIGPNKPYFVRVEGESMIGANIDDGCLILINPNVEVRSGDIAYIRWHERCSVKGIIFYRDGRPVPGRTASPPPLRVRGEVSKSVVPGLSMILSINIF